MATLREVKKRIKSVKNIAQITRALEAVSASRVRKAQARVIASRAYAEKAWEILLNLQNASKGKPLHPLLVPREEINSTMVVLITSERGLAGAYNSNVLRVAERFEHRLGKPVRYVAVGRKGRDRLIRQNADLVAEFTDMPAEPSISDVMPIAQLALDAYQKGEVDEVLIAYTDFVGMLAQRPTILGWLPLTTDSVANQVVSEYVKDIPDVSGGDGVYEFEPDPEAVAYELVPRFTQLQLYQALLESIASEHAARMAAMRNATDNATQLTEDLTLEYNKARQSAITSEILDIVGGAEALQQAINNTAKAILKETKPVSIVEDVVVVETSGNGKAEKKDGKKPKGESRDNLKKIEGIGPKMEKALHSAGIYTFEQLAQTPVSEIRAAVEAAGMSFAPSLDTWAEQAEIAAKGDWDVLEELQNRLNAGRRG